jgi:hypothetical protein
MKNHDIAKKAERPMAVFRYWYREFYPIENLLIWNVQGQNGKEIMLIYQYFCTLWTE